MVRLEPDLFTRLATPSSYPSSFRASDSHPVADNPGWKKNAAGFDYNPR